MVMWRRRQTNRTSTNKTIERELMEIVTDYGQHNVDVEWRQRKPLTNNRNNNNNKRSGIGARSAYALLF